MWLNRQLILTRLHWPIAEEHNRGKTNKHVAANYVPIFQLQKQLYQQFRGRLGSVNWRSHTLHSHPVLGTRLLSGFRQVCRFAGFKTDEGTGGAEDLLWCPRFEGGTCKGQDKWQGHWRAALLVLLQYVGEYFLCPSKRNTPLLETNATDQESAT